MYYISKSTSAFYIEDINSFIPEDAVKISFTLYKELLNGCLSGKSVFWDEGNNPYLVSSTLTIDQLVCLEKDWVTNQLSYATEELNKVQDSDPNAKGSVADWRSYRKSLRAWHTHLDFPNKEFRPVAPGA